MNALPYITSISTLVLTALIGVFVWFEAFFPITFWFEYHEIVSTQDVYEPGALVRFHSIVDYHKSVQVEWIDILRCDLDSDPFGFSYFSVYESAATILPKSSNDFSSAWTYQAPTPQEDATCFLDSTTTLILPLGIRRSASIESNTFRIDS